MSKKTKEKYIKGKRQLFRDLCIPLSDEVVNRMLSCSSEVAIDNIAHSVIVNHTYSSKK